MSFPLISLTDVSYDAPRQWGHRTACILQNIDISFEQGTCTTIIGPNGCGKTTLLKILMGIISPTKGSVYKNGMVKFGYLPQHLSYNRFLTITVKQLLHLLSPHQESEKETLACLEAVKAQHLIHHFFNDLSGGQKQRVLLACILATKANVLVLDEPTQGIDVQGQSDFYEIIKNGITEKKWTVIMVSHDMHLVMRHTNQVICLNKHICCQGTPQQIYESKEYAQLFPNVVGLAPYLHHHDHDHV